MRSDYGPVFGGSIWSTIWICDECNTKKSRSQFGISGTGFERNGDDCGTFVGRRSSGTKRDYYVDDYDYYDYVVS